MKSKILIILSLFFWGNSYAQYCTGGPSFTGDSNVQSVSLVGATTNINHTACPGVSGTEDLTAQIADLIAGLTYTVDVQFGTCGGNYGGAGEVWIDFNQDDVFQATESVGTWAGTPPVALSSFTFTVPPASLPGITRMRVVQQEGGSNPLNPCATYNWGSMMDFGITIMPGTPITCPFPTAVTVANLTATTADISWTAGGSAAWIVEYGPSGFTPGSAGADTTFITVNNNPLSLTGLSSGTDYDFYVRAFCAPGDSSFNIGPASFFTPGTCGTYVLDLYDTWGDGWNGGNLSVTINGVVEYTGLTVTTGNGPVLFNIPLNTGDLISINYTEGSFTSENEYTLYDENGTVIVYEGASNTTPNNFGPYEACPTCPSPFSLNTTSITSNSATLNWSTGGSTSWLVEYGPTGFTPGVGTLTTTNPFNLTGLSPATAYDWYIRDYCLPGDSSMLVGPITFNTSFLAPNGVACITGASSILFSEDFEGAIDATPAGWSGNFSGASGQWGIPSNLGSSNTGPNNGNTASGNQHMEFEGSGTGTASAITPPINLTTANDEVELSFYMHAFGVEMGTFNINVSTSPAGPFTPIFTFSGQYQTSGNDLWEHIAVDLTAYIGQVIYLEFENTNTATWEADIAIDLIEVTSCVTCPAPSAFTASGITDSSIDLAWTTGGASVWLVEYGPSGFTPGNGDSTILAFTTPTLTVTGLSPATSYDFYVSDFCALGDTSIALGLLNIATDFLSPDGVLCITGSSSVLFSEDFEGALHSTPNGWIGNFNGNSGNWDVTAANSNNFASGPSIPVSGNQHMEFESSTTVTANAISPPINLTTSNNEVELAFWMHAYGANMGTFNINIGNSPTGPFLPIFTYSGQLQTTAASPWEHIAVDLTAYIGQIVYLQFTNSMTSGFNGDMSIDLIEVTSCLTCPAPTNVVTSGVTENSVDVDWTPSSAFVWLLEYGPAGFTPGNGDSAIVAPAHPYTITGLNASTVYDVYVYDLCGDTSFAAGPGRFATDCDTVPAPYYQNFDIDLNDPHCWSATGPENWLYQISGGPGPDYGVAGSVDHTTGTSNFAWIDASGGLNTNELVSPVIDYSGLTQGIVGCWILSNNTTNAFLNLIHIEAFDGTSWVQLATYSGNNSGWIRFYATIPAAIPNVTTFRLVQEEGSGTGSAFNNDILVDDFFVEEAPTCFNPTMLSDSVISPTLVELSWTTGGASDWIIEYGPTGFIPGTGAGTLVNTNQNPYVLSVNAGQDYDWYVQDSCGPTDISWHSYVNNFRMPGEVDCDSVSTNFTYCYADNEVELYTYQSSNSTSFLHLVFNSGVLNSNDDFAIYDGPDETYPLLFATTTGTNNDMTGLEFTSSSNIISFAFNTLFFPNSGCTTPLDFDINCCETTYFSQTVDICTDSTYTLPDGVVVNSEAVYYSTIENIKGCDSIVTTIINILEDSTTVTDIICAGSSYLLPDGNTTTSMGNYQMVVSNYLGCDSAIDLTLVLVQPSFFSINASICAGDSYEMPNSTFVNTAGNHDLIYINSEGCDSTYSVNLTLNPLTPLVMDPIEMCEGETRTLVDGVEVSTSGTFTSQTINLNGCSVTATTVVTVSPSSFSNDTIKICGNETYTLLNGDVVEDAGEYNINVGNSNGCDSIVTIYVSKCIASGITNEENNAVASIFPNPSSSMINVTFNTNVINGELDIRVMNALGQEIDLFEDVSETNLTINVSSYSDGMYYLVVSDNANTSIKKFVVSK